MAHPFQFEHTVTFDAATADAVLATIPAAPGVFALCGARPEDEPYLTRATNLRRRMHRLLDAPTAQSKRLNLREKVARIEYSVTGSEFEALHVLYQATAAQFGYTEARRKLRLHTPFFIRFAMENAYPRAYVTNRLSKRALDCLYGPFPSRTAAERALDEALNLFKLRRCSEELAPDPAFPGCVYSEMKMCLAPCFKGCTDERYNEEALAVRDFLATRGESMLTKLTAERERASEEMEFEKAAAIHGQMQKVKAIANLADEIVRPLAQLEAVLIQPTAAIEADEPARVALFLIDHGCIAGPEIFSTFGMWHANRNSGSSSLFAHPHMLAAVPLDETGNAAVAPLETTEERLQRVLATLEAQHHEAQEMAMLSDHLSLLRRWYYRPAKQRVGEIFFKSGTFPVRRMLNGISRVVLGEPAARAEDVAASDAPQAVPGDA